MANHLIVSIKRVPSPFKIGGGTLLYKVAFVVR
jgi:hypothetical protein